VTEKTEIERPWLFQKGQSGNPKGRPIGARHKVTLAIEAMLDEKAENLVNVAMEKALEGDVVALRLCLDRICPPRKDRPISFEMPKIEKVEDSSKLTAGLLAAVAAGDVTPDEAAVVAGLIEKHVRIREASNFEARLKALEERFGGEVR
jgi:hypothetical protein